MKKLIEALTVLGAGGAALGAVGALLALFGSFGASGGMASNLSFILVQNIGQAGAPLR